MGQRNLTTHYYTHEATCLYSESFAVDGGNNVLPSTILQMTH